MRERPQVQAVLWGELRMHAPSADLSKCPLPHHVVFVCANYFPRVTGVGVVLDGWARRLARLGILTTVLAPQYPDCAYYPPHDPPANLQVVRMPSRPVPFAPGLRVMQWSHAPVRHLVDALANQRVVIHAQDPLNAGQVAVRLARLIKAPLITHVHSPVFGMEVRDWLGDAVGAAAEPLAHCIVRRAVLRTLRASKRVVAVSEYVANLFAERSLGKPEVLPCGIESPVPEDVIQDVRGRHGIPPESPLLLYVGRLEPDKGVNDLLAAFQRVLRALPQAVLLLVGGGPLTRRYERTAARLGIARHTVFAGWRAHREVWSYYRQADLFVIANADEAQGLVVLEAQACGLPVAGYRSGGIGLMVRSGETGLLCEPRPDALALTILRLLADRDLRSALGRNGPAWAQRFRADDSFRALLRVYQEALLGSGHELRH